MLKATAAICVAEFVGTFLLVFSIGCNTLADNGVWGILSVACLLVALVYSFAGISGGHFNPAVTLALAAAGKVAPGQVLVYCGIQLLAGVCGAWAYVSLFWKTIVFAPMQGSAWWHIALAEGFYTFMLCFVVLNSGPQRSRGHQFFGLAIGLVLVAGGCAAAGLTGGCFNPAVAIGLDLASAGLNFGWSLVYVGFELTGAALASVLFRVVRPRDFYAGTLRAAQVNPSASLPMLVSEMVGTFMVVLTFALAAAADSPAWALAVGCAVLSMSFALGDVCGVHFNPAVTLAVIASCRGKCSAMQGVRFIAAQVFAGLLAVAVASLLRPPEVIALQHEGFGAASAAMSEAIFTFVMCMTFLVTIVVDGPCKLTEYFGVANAAATVAGSYALANISGGALNPAIALPLTLISPVGPRDFLTRGLAYSLAECAAALLAAVLFWIVCPDSLELQSLALQGKARMHQAALLQPDVAMRA